MSKHTPDTILQSLNKMSGKSLVLWQETPETDKEAWLLKRRDSYGASDAPAALGLSPFMTPNDLWLDKLGKRKRTETKATRAGTDNEKAIVEEYYSAHRGMTFPREAELIYPFPTISDPQKKIHCTPDACIVWDHGYFFLEVKYSTDNYRWRNGVPNHYRAQCAWSMYVTGAPSWVLAWKIKKTAIQHVCYPANLGSIEDLTCDMVKAVRNHRLCVENECIPDISTLFSTPDGKPKPGSLDFVRSLYPIVDEEHDGEWFSESVVSSLLDDYHAQKSTLSVLRKRVEAIEDQMKALQARILWETCGAKSVTLSDGRTIDRSIVKVPPKDGFSYEKLSLRGKDD